MIRKLSLVLGVFILIILTSGIGEAQVNYYYSINPTAFRPRADSIDFYVASDWGWAENTSTLSYAYFYAPIHLPEGAKIKKIYCYVYDLNLTWDITIGLIKRSNVSSENYIMYSATSNAAPGAYTLQQTTAFTVTGRIVANKKWNYLAYIYIPSVLADSNLRWGGFRILYEY